MIIIKATEGIPAGAEGTLNTHSFWRAAGKITRADFPDFFDPHVDVETIPRKASGTVTDCGEYFPNQESLQFIVGGIVEFFRKYYPKAEFGIATTRRGPIAYVFDDGKIVGLIGN